MVLDVCKFKKEIFDEDKNLIGVAKLANPVMKKESEDFTFKLKLDMIVYINFIYITHDISYNLKVNIQDLLSILNFTKKYG